MRKAAALVSVIIGAAFLSGAYAQAVQPTLVPKPAPIASQLQPPLVKPALPTGGAQPLTAENVDAWLDGYMPISIGRADIPGAVVVVVKDGQILTSRGYGFSDVEKRKPVDPHTTLFRPGSTSKLFTWAAVMNGQHTSWDFQPRSDASRQYMRNHLDLNEVEAIRRYPQPE